MKMIMFRRALRADLPGGVAPRTPQNIFEAKKQGMATT